MGNGIRAAQRTISFAVILRVELLLFAIDVVINDAYANRVTADVYTLENITHSRYA